MDKEYYTIKEFCKYFSISRQTFYRWLDSGIVNATRIGTVIRVSREEIQRIEQTARGD